MRNSIFLALVFIALFSRSNQVFGTHIAGTDISVTYIGPDPNVFGNNLYILTANLFRDCNPTSAGLGNTVTICQWNTCGNDTSYIIPRLPGYPLDVTQVCDDPTVTTECNGGILPGYELHRYADTLSIGNPTNPCGTYVFSTAFCCRNTTTNLPGQPSFYTDLVYYYNNDPTNSTPQYVSSFPIPYKCLAPNQTVSFNALEVQADSLSYVIAPARGFDLAQPSCPPTIETLAYVAPFTAINPFASPIGTNVNAQSGVVTFTPIQLGNYVLAVQVVEVDPVTLDTLSTSIRDIQVVVENCSNLAPYDPIGGIDTIRGQGEIEDSVSIAICVGDSFEIDVIVGDTAALGIPSFDTLDVWVDSLQAIMPGAILTHTGTFPLDTITLKWVATQGTSPLFGFPLTVSDNACPIPGIKDFSFNVRIKPSAQITAEQTICLGDTVHLNASGGNVISWGTLPGGTSLDSNVNYFPSNDLSSAMVIPTETTSYVLITDNTTCNATDTLTVVIATQNPSISLDSLYCFNVDPAPVLTAATPGGVWTGTGIHPTTGVLDMNILDPGPRTAEETYEVVYTFVSTTGCVSTDTAEFVVANYNAILDSLPMPCFGDSTTINLRDWSYFDFGEFISVPNGSAEFLGPNLTQDGLLSLAGLDPGTYAIRHLLNKNCAVPFDTTITIHLLPKGKITDFEEIYCSHNADSVFFGSTNPGGQWGGNAIVDPTKGAIVPGKVGAGNYALSYTVIDPITRCQTQDVVNFKISDNPTRPRIHGVGPFCEGDVLKDLTADGLRTNRFRWYSDAAGTEESLLHRGRKFNVGELNETIELYATQTNEDGCESYTAGIVLDVWPYPTPDFDADVWQGIKLPLEVNFNNLTTDAETFLWNFGDGQVFDEREPEQHFYTDLGIYNVTLTADNGVCVKSITKQVLADAEVVVNVPNVFTPNGDGQNDLWNPVWENIDQAEVTILNRWGKPVYEFSNPQDSWDGGKQKDGTYFYIIKGIEHSLTAKPIQYTGDITLIRGE